MADKKKKYKISFEVWPEEAKDEVLKLLKVLRANGIVGASRHFGIVDPSTEEEKEWSIFFDGDGDHRLDDIRINNQRKKLIRFIELRIYYYRWSIAKRMRKIKNDNRCLNCPGIYDCNPKLTHNFFRSLLCKWKAWRRSSVTKKRKFIEVSIDTGKYDVGELSNSMGYTLYETVIHYNEDKITLTFKRRRLWWRRS
jgi:hypothetical protein